MTKGKRMILEHRDGGTKRAKIKNLNHEGHEGPRRETSRTKKAAFTAAFVFGFLSISCFRYLRASTKSARQSSNSCSKPAACRLPLPSVKLPRPRRGC